MTIKNETFAQEWDALLERVLEISHVVQDKGEWDKEDLTYGVIALQDLMIYDVNLGSIALMQFYDQDPNDPPVAVADFFLIECIDIMLWSGMLKPSNGGKH